jgi:ribosome-binding protein aMBF1 (putative translation factor)
MKKEIDDPEVLRREIRTMLEKVTDRGSLIFFQWLIGRISANDPLPGDEELKTLHQAFIRFHATFRAKKAPTKEDMELVGKWTDGDAFRMGKALGRAVKFFREKRCMSRLQLAKKAHLPIQTILAIERGKVFNLSPVLDNLTQGLSVEAGELTDKLLDFEKGDSDEQK